MLTNPRKYSNKASLHVSLTKETKESLEKLSEKLAMTQSDIVELAVEDYLDIVELTMGDYLKRGKAKCQA